MSTQKGTINVQTENIFPIIKKFLYSDHEIFLRELVSNAVDATQKLKMLASAGNVKEELGDLTIDILLDKEAKTLTIRDRGIGMTAEEVDKYINQIAFSSAEEFVAKFKKKSEADAQAIIGHFGLGFYSSFMVADQVELKTKTYKRGAGTKAVQWSCDGSPEYQIDELDKTQRGTEVVLHIADDSTEFLEENRILELLNKYCKFLPVPIRFGEESKWEKIEGEKDEDGNDKYDEKKVDRIINNTEPAWKKSPSSLSDEDYKSFYRELYPMTFDEPLFNIHINVDYPFNLTGILYFPKVKNNFEVQKNKIQLYSNQVFITDSVEGVVPDFLTLLHGVIDSPDIPLNVSRSYLQSDANVKKISNHIMKKVSDKLHDLFKDDREDFQKKWDDIKIFLEYGMITEEKFFDKARDYFLFKNTRGEYFTLEEYKEKISVLQTDKDNKIVTLYTNNEKEQFSYISAAGERSYDVIVMDSPISSHFINLLESKLENQVFKRVDADVVDKLIAKEEDLPSKLSDDELEKIKPVFEGAVDKETYHVQFESLSENELPVMITMNEFTRRMKDMQAVGGGNMMMGNLPDSYNLIVNSNHPLVGQLLEDTEENQQSTVRQLIDLAKLSQNLLKGEDLSEFIKRSVSIIK